MSMNYTRLCNKMAKRKAAALVIAVLLLDEDDECKVIKKKKWCKKWLLDRNKYSHMKLLKELEQDEPTDFKNYLRMDSDTYMTLLTLISEKITKQDTIMRNAIPVEERLVATLRYLATGCSYEDLKFRTGMSPQALSKIIPETCEAIYSALKKSYLKVPSTEAEWQEVSRGFQNLWQFSNCLGAIDGKHINITKPAGSGSYFYNYKGTYSVVLFAIVNANYEFIYVHTGTNGRVSDGGIWSQTSIYKNLLAKKLNIPNPTKLPGMEEKVPYVFIGDEAFPLMENLMKPYSQRNITYNEKIFNYRLCRARRVVENAFGILASRFRIFLQPINISVDKIDIIILASCALHNFLRKTSNSNCITEQCIDREDFNNGNIIPGQWRQQTGNNPIHLEKTKMKNVSSVTKNVRETYKKYFNTVGSVFFKTVW
nr:protein ALP1-like [Onthophagus taurus]XP_022900759.1 protein ALP1-like [Onthophagus taurus]